MTQNRLGAWALLIGSALATSGCGSQEQSDAPPAAVVAPQPAPSPGATTVAQPASLSFSSFEVGVDVDDAGAFRLSAPIEQRSSPITITDPDAPNAARFNDIKFDGDEIITTSGFGPTANRQVVTSPSLLRSSAAYSFTQAGTLNRRLPNLAWNAAAGSEPVSLPLIEVAEKTPNTSSTTERYPRNGRLLEVGAVSARALRVFGSPTTIVPATGVRRYVGEVFGSVYPTAEAPSRLVGDAIINVFFGTKPYATGLINFSQYERSDNTGLPLKIEFTADIVDGKLVTRSIVVTGTGKALAFGSVAGGFYGDDASDLGFTAAARGPTGIAIFGAVLEVDR